jgi:hypothetical protein
MNEILRGIYPYSILLKEKTKQRIDVLIAAYSYETRVVDSLKRCLAIFDIKRAVLLSYDGDKFLDRSDIEKRNRVSDEIDALLRFSNLPTKRISCKHDDVVTIQDELRKLVSPSDRVLVDVTGFTKNYILALAKALNHGTTLFFYTQSLGHRVPSMEEMSISVSSIQPIVGFEGYVSVNKSDLLILVLGYEGNRSLAFLRKFETEPILALIGSPHYEDEKRNLIYVESARKANLQLLNVHRVYLHEKFIHSLDPFLFAQDLEDAVKEHFNSAKYNFCVSCLGTKMQTLGLYVYWKRNPGCQIWYTIPNKRFDISSDAGESWIVKLDDTH